IAEGLYVAVAIREALETAHRIIAPLLSAVHIVRIERILDLRLTPHIIVAISVPIGAPGGYQAWVLHRVEQARCVITILGHRIRIRALSGCLLRHAVHGVKRVIPDDLAIWTGNTFCPARCIVPNRGGLAADSD